MIQKNGFSLVELLVVLSIVSFLLLIGGSVQMKTYDQYQFNQWYQLFESDMLRMQQNSMITNENQYLLINSNSNQYEIRQGGLGKIVLKRPIPPHWKIKLYSLQMPVSYSKHGTIRKPGKFQVETAYQSWEIIFPFGKGRCYVIQL